MLMFMACTATAQITKSTVPTASIPVLNIFNDEEVRWFFTAGAGTIKGSAKFKARSGEVRYGKEFRIELMPFSKYTEERLGHLYPDKNSGFIFVQDGVPRFTPDPTGYHDTKKTMCNENGEFAFHDLPAGEYYVIAFMLWDGKSGDGSEVKEGGGIMRRIRLESGGIKEIEMSNF
jgi:hypothetical protein